MAATFVVYIDESGDEGLRFRPGVSEWFIVSAVITRKATDLETVKLINDFRRQVGRHPKKPLHFRKLKHDERLILVNDIARADLRAISVLIHKPSLASPEVFEEGNRLYFYGSRYLLERVSWYCRDHYQAGDAGDGTAEIVFSARSDLSYDNFSDYMRRLQASPNPGINWTVINSRQIEAYSPGKRMGLQIADAVASGTMQAVRCLPEGKWCDAYARSLKSVMYHRNGQYWGYGLKVFPGQVDRLLTTEPRFQWMNEEYRQIGKPQASGLRIPLR